MLPSDFPELAELERIIEEGASHLDARTACEVAAGERRFHWDGRDTAGRALGSGVYLCRLRAAGREETRKMTLLK